MRTLLKVLLCAVVLNLSVSSAWAIPAFKKAFEQKYGSNPSIAAATRDANCFVCHFGKNDKRNRNDYGKALSEYLQRENFKDDRFKNEPAQVKKELEEAFKKVEEMKVKDGSTTFGERLKAGKLPGTPE